MKQVGLNPDELEITKPALRAFGKAKSLTMDDDAFRAAVKLADDASMTAAEIKGLVNKVCTSQSPELRQETLNKERDAREEVIAAGRNGQTHKNLTGSLKTRLKYLMDHPVAVFVEKAPDEVDEYLELLTAAEHRIAEIRAAHAKMPASTSSYGQRPEVRQ
jgi:hypothetical protein